MTPNASGSIWTVLCFAALLALDARGQTTAARVRSTQAAVNTAQAKLTQAQQTWDKAQQDLGRALATQQSASNKVLQARQGAAQRHGPGIGMTAAAAERDAALHQLNARRKVIEAELKARDDYKLAELEAETARKRLSDLSDDKSLTDEERQRLSSELAAKVRRPTEMHKETEAKDPEMKRGAERLQTAGRKIVELQPLMKQAIDADAAVTQALEQEKKDALATEKARTTATRVQQDVVNAQLNLDRQEQQLQALLGQTRRHR